ncbi:MAG: DHH family phosphoesterase [Chitinophagaceae bacterium]|nr:DHH family phosphoesterase [Chitinophagaceae bacterium]
MNPIEEIFPVLAAPKKVIITMHQKPDPDAMGSSLALYHLLVQLGHSVTVVSPTNWPAFLNWMPGCEDVLDYENNRQREKIYESLMNADLLFCLDFNAISRAKHFAAPIKASSCKKILIDHHQQPETASFDYGISDTSKSSTSEMIYNFIWNGGYRDKMNTSIAECLYAGVMGDTGSFRYASASESVHRMIADLKALGLKHTPVHDNIYDNFLENRLRFLGHVLLNRMQVFYEYNTALISVPKTDLLKFEIRTGDTEGLVNFPLTIQGIKMAAICIDRDEERKWSFRSKGEFDVNTFARNYFEGGGHYNAAGGHSSESLEKTIHRFKEALKENASQLQ